MSDPIISVVIPAYNAAPYLAETLDSVLAQTFTRWECLIVDDGSKDKTAVIAQTYAERDPRVRLIRQKNAGVSSARNTGYANAAPQSAYLIFLDADDLWKPQALTTLHTALEADATAPAAHGNSCLVNSHSELVRPGEAEEWTRHRSFVADKGLSVAPADAPTTFSMLVYAPCIMTPGVVLIRRAALVQVGLFDIGFASVADIDMWARLARRAPILFVDMVILCYRQHNSNMSSNRRIVVREKQQYWRKTLCAPENSPKQRLLVARSYRAFYLQQAKHRLRECRHNVYKGAFKETVQKLPLIVANLLMALRGCPK